MKMRYWVDNSYWFNFATEKHNFLQTNVLVFFVSWQSVSHWTDNNHGHIYLPWEGGGGSQGGHLQKHGDVREGDPEQSSSWLPPSQSWMLWSHWLLWLAAHCLGSGSSRQVTPQLLCQHLYWSVSTCSCRCSTSQAWLSYSDCWYHWTVRPAHSQYATPYNITTWICSYYLLLPSQVWCQKL